MKKNIWLIGVLLLVLIVAGCGGGSTKTEDQTDTTQNNESQEPIEIGFVSPMTGHAADLGSEAWEGAEAGVKLINDNGGVNGRPIKLVKEDDKGTPEGGVTATRKLIEKDGVRYVFGTMHSSVAIAISNVIKEYDDVLYFISGAMAPQTLDDNNGMIFGFNPTNQMYSEAYFKWLLDKYAPKSVGVIAEKTDYGENDLKALTSQWGQPGTPEILGVERFEMESLDMTPQLTRLKAMNPDMIYVVSASGKVQSTIWNQARDLNFKPRVRAVAAGSLYQSAVDLASEAMEDVVGMDIYSPLLPNDKNQEFLKIMNDSYGKNPSAIHQMTYSSILMIADALRKANPEDPADVAKTLKESKWETPRGTIGFNERGRAISDFVPVTAKGGKVVILSD